MLVDSQGLLGQMAGRQTGIDALRKAAESLIASEGDLLSNTDEIQESVGKLILRQTRVTKKKKKTPATCHYEGLF